MATYVLVPGGWHGAWVYDGVASELRRLGHEAFSVTLTGLGERAQLLARETNLDTHIEDVVGVIQSLRAEKVVLCGHSYAGLVITGAADRLLERIAALVYIDAYVPSDGDSCWSLTNETFRRVFAKRATADGCVAPPLGLDPRATPHPLASLLQPVRLSRKIDKIGRRTFIYCSGWAETPLTATYERLRNDPCWTVHVLGTGHNLMSEAPDKLLEVLLSASPTSVGGGVA
jgi:pimeloyl-ACP methyl ester carboxylesterase